MNFADPAYSSQRSFIPLAGDPMTKSGTLITSALLTFGIAAAAMAADMPKSAAPMAADTPACGYHSPLRPRRRAEAKSTSKKHEQEKEGNDSRAHDQVIFFRDSPRPPHGGRGSFVGDLVDPVDRRAHLIQVALTPIFRQLDRYRSIDRTGLPVAPRCNHRDRRRQMTETARSATAADSQRAAGSTRVQEPPEGDHASIIVICFAMMQARRRSAQTARLPR